MLTENILICDPSSLKYMQPNVNRKTFHTKLTNTRIALYIKLSYIFDNNPSTKIILYSLFLIICSNSACVSYRMS